MDIWSLDKITIFVGFFIPGFISMQVYRLFVAGDDEDLAKKLPAVVSYSAIHYALLGWVILITTGRLQIIFSYLIVFICPILWPFVILLLRDFSKWSVNFVSIGKIRDAMLKPEATPWDRVFANKDRFVRVTLKDGKMIGGYLADFSEVSTFPAPEQIFIKNEHVIDQIDGAIGEPVPLTGILVNGSEIRYIEVVEKPKIGDD